ncbi:hypothetical protein ACFZB6_19340 [Streptomyces syringium]|uniref:hypothetical protein n=1 Tax=Streptomyces syringium TaxID=76729 RepID=UPI0036E6B4E6
MSSTDTLLGDIIKPAALRRAGTEELPILSMTMRDGLVDQADKFKKRVASADTSAYRVVDRGQLVVGFPIDEGVLSFQRLYDSAIVSPAYEIWDLMDSDSVSRDFLERFLRSPRALSYYTAKLQGSTARRRSLPRDIFLALPVPLPSFGEQERIAAVLDQVESLRAKRREAIDLLDDLSASIFLDMFGDPLQNSQGWDRLPMSDFLTGIESGKSPQCLERQAEGEEWGVLKLGAVTRCVYLQEENKALPSEVAPDARKEVKAGDLLFTRKNTPDLVAASAYVRSTRSKLLMPDLIFRLDVADGAQVDKIYLHALLTHPGKRRRIQELATGSSASMVNISKAKLLALVCEIPPLEMQREFAQRVDAVEGEKEIHRTHLAALDELFTSIQHRAFSGTLWDDEAPGEAA